MIQLYSFQKRKVSGFKNLEGKESDKYCIETKLKHVNEN